MDLAQLWKPVFPFDGRGCGASVQRPPRFPAGTLWWWRPCPLCPWRRPRCESHFVQLCENTSVLISYPLKTHISRATPFRQGVARKRNMALGLRKLFLSDPGGRLRARDEQNRFARARITVVAAPDPNHAYLHKPHGQLVSPTSNQPRNASLHPTPHPRVVGTVSSTRNPLTHFQATYGQYQDPKGVMVALQGAQLAPQPHLGPKLTLEVPALHL